MEGKVTNGSGADFGDLVARRSSTRRYLPDRVPADLLKRVMAAGEGAEALTGNEMAFVIPEERERTEDGMTGLFGGYGRVIRAPHYIVLLARPGEGYLPDAGYRFEQMILEATRLGLGTCWVGGFFREERLSRSLGAEGGLVPVVLSPLGYPDTGRGARMIDGSMKLAVGASSRKPVEELFFWKEAGVPLPGELAGGGEFSFVAETVRRAPSWANRQPWRFILAEERVFLYKAGVQVKEGRDYHLVDCGIAMSHLHLAMRALGREGRWTLGGEGAPEGPAGSSCVGRYEVRGGLFGGL